MMPDGSGVLPFGSEAIAGSAREDVAIELVDIPWTKSVEVKAGRARLPVRGEPHFQLVIGANRG